MICKNCNKKMFPDIEGGVVAVSEDEQQYREYLIWVCDDCNTEPREI